jgi:hypothetical protein
MPRPSLILHGWGFVNKKPLNLDDLSRVVKQYCACEYEVTRA